MSFTSMSPRLDSRWSGSFPLPGRELHPLEAPGFAWRTEHLREVFGGHRAETITADAVRRYQLHRRKQGAEAATINRETSALSRMLQLAIRHGLLERMPLFPKRLEENPPRDGFFEHDEYLKVRAHAPASYQPGFPFWPSLMARLCTSAPTYREIISSRSSRLRSLPGERLSSLELTGSDAISVHPRDTRPLLLRCFARLRVGLFPVLPHRPGVLTGSRLARRFGRPIFSLTP